MAFALRSWRNAGAAMLRRPSAFACLLALGAVACFGGGARLEDRTTEPLLAAVAIEEVAALDLPPGNLAVSAEGRVFFTFHPEGGPETKLAEWVDGRAVPWPSAEWQSEREGAPYFQTPLSIRIDRQSRLWVLDFASYALGTPRLLAFDVASGELVHDYDFPSEVAGFGSMLNDFQVDPAGARIYIAESSPFLRTPAVVVYDVETKKSRRVLDGHPSVLPEDYVIQAPGRDMVILGIYTLRIGIDSIALDRTGEWLYYGAVNSGRLYRVRAADLVDESLSADVLGSRVEEFAAKTLSDGLSTDVAGNVYLTDMEHSAIVQVTPERKLATLAKDPRLRWPDGLSFGPDGWLYVTCSDLQDVIFKSAAHVRASAPFHIYRLKPGPPAPAGQ